MIMLDLIWYLNKFVEFNTMYWVYVIACEDDILYVGETIQLVNRLRAHLKGQGSA